MISDQEVWMRAWEAVASTFNAKAPDCTRYADVCLKDYRERFLRPAQHWPARSPTTMTGGEAIAPKFGASV